MGRVRSSCVGSRKLAPFFIFKQAPTGFRTKSSPLFEEEWDSCVDALVFYFENPFFEHRPRTGSTLATDYYPVDTIEIHFPHRSNEGLDRKNAHARVPLSNMLN